jgi:hypothetical protein
MTGEYGKAIARSRRKGPWELVGIADVFEGVERENREFAECEFCGYPRVRYVHSIARADKELEVGCVCACHLCASEEPRIAEQAFKSRQARRVTVLRQRKVFCDLDSDGWHWTAKQNLRRTVCGRNVVIFHDRYGRGFCVVIDNDFGKKYPTSKEALEEAAKILYPMPEEEQLPDHV